MRFKVSTTDTALVFKLPPESQAGRPGLIPADWIGGLAPENIIGMQCSSVGMHVPGTKV